MLISLPNNAKEFNELGKSAKALKEEKFAVDTGPIGTDDVDFRDENDDMLAGVSADDMDDLLGDLAM